MLSGSAHYRRTKEAFLKERMDLLGIECVLRNASDYTGDRQPQFYGDMVEFFLDHFPRETE
ncbi:MAG: hypothetical protein NTW86_06905 [Candidatus Sumerlaeota bacterium]|nr:hypothetical protein [Candidatus Sumerlaeota bacterium]